jgi:DNA repair protein RadA/Sms
MEGSRPLLVEIQALATRAPYGAPQRVAAGFDHKRLAVLLAVLEKRVGIPFGQLDIFLNVVGGLRVIETSADAAVAVALASTAQDRIFPADSVVLGELGLGGEMRPVSQMERRLGEAARMGFKQAFIPSRGRKQTNDAPLRIVEVADVGGLLERALA